jgi:hypothetical protein
MRFAIFKRSPKVFCFSICVTSIQTWEYESLYYGTDRHVALKNL